MFHSQIGTQNRTVLKLPIWEQHVPFTHKNSEQNSANLLIWEQYVPFTNGNSEQNGAKCPIANKLFHLQMGTRNKTVLNLVLNDQFGNKVSHSQMGIWNKTVLNHQFGNNLFH